MSLKNRTLYSFGWTSLGQLFSICLRLGSNLMMTRILTPDAYGITAISNALLITLSLVSDVGINQSVIAKKGSSNASFLNTAWTLQVVRNALIATLNLFIGLSLYVLISSGSLVGESVFADLQLAQVLFATSFIVFMDGFRSVRMITVQKKLNFRYLIILELIAQLTALPLMYVCATEGFGVWSLIIGNAWSSIIVLLGSYTIEGLHFPRFAFNLKVVKSILQFGKWILASSGLHVIFILGDKFIIGALFSARELGIYSIAMLWITALKGLIANIIGRVGLPVISELIHTKNRENAQRAYYKMRKILDTGIIFISFCVLFSGEFLIKVMYNDEYEYAGYLLSLLSFTLFSSIYELKSKILLSIGDSKGLFFSNLVGSVVLCVVAFWGVSQFSLIGVIYALIAAETAKVFYLFFRLRLVNWINFASETLVLALAIGLLPVAYFCSLALKMIIEVFLQYL